MRYPCEECDYKAISKSYLKVHIESVHKKVNNLNDIFMIRCLFVCHVGRATQISDIRFLDLRKIYLYIIPSELNNLASIVFFLIDKNS